MHIEYPDPIQAIINTIQKAGYELYLVGGTLRDLLLTRPVTDWDFTTNATPDQMLTLFQNAFYDNSFGTVGVPVEEIDGKGVIDITTYRTERDYTDRRHPGTVTWGNSIEEDLQRRDFTINAMALNAYTITEDGIIDPYQGKADLEQKVIRAVGNANLRFKEDALRMMRAVRFATQLQFTIEENTFAAIKEDAQLLKHIAFERIRDELFKILASDYPYEGIMLLKETGLLQYILPELLEGIGVSQERPGRHHKEDVFTHNMLSLKYTTASDPLVRLAALIHDIGKPRVQATDDEGLVIFYNHEIIGAKLAGEIAEKLRLSKKQKEKLTTLVRWHMFTVDEHITDAAIRRFIRRIGVNNVKDMMDLRVGDRLGGGTQTAESWRLKLFKKRVEEQLGPEPFSIKHLAINGHDIMQALNIPPGPQIGKLLQKLFEEVDEDLSKNTKEYLLDRIKQIA